MSRKPVFFWWALALGTALALCYLGAGIQFWRHAGESKEYGWYRDLRGGSWYVTWVAPDGPAAGILRVRDRILEFEGHTGPDWYANRIVFLAPGGGFLQLTVERDGRRIEVAVPVRRVPAPVDWGIPVMAGASLVCFAVALAIGLLKPGDRTVQIGCFTFMALAALQLTNSLEYVYLVLDDWGRVIAGMVALADPLPLAARHRGEELRESSGESSHFLIAPCDAW